MNDNMDVKMLGKVLFTGNGDLVIDDLMAHMPGNLRAEKCPLQDQKLFSAMSRLRPHALVVILSDDSQELRLLCSMLEENAGHHRIPMLAVGSPEACSIFSKNIFQKKVRIFERPLDRAGFMDTLEAYVYEGIAAELERKNDSVDQAPPVEEEIDPFGKKSILVVDDDVRMLNVIKMYLQDLFDVTIVPSGKLALKFLNKKHADLVLLDYMMPEEDGPAVLRKIRNETPEPDIPVLFLTGVNDRSLVMRCLELRPNGYLLKPVTKNELLERVTEILLDL